MEEVKHSGKESPAYNNTANNRNLESMSPAVSMQRMLGQTTEFTRNWVELRLMGQ